jgi:5-methylcytosine-specific restriction endonuclease McrA
MREMIIPSLRRGKDHPKWKGGLPKCTVCGQRLANRYARKCKKHRFISKETLEKRMEFYRKRRLERPIDTRHTPEYRDWRVRVYARDNYRCTWCGEGGRLNADHILSIAMFPEFALDVDNGRTLCVPCHKKTSTYLKRPDMEGYKLDAHINNLILVSKMLDKACKRLVV